MQTRAILLKFQIVFVSAVQRKAGAFCFETPRRKQQTPEVKLQLRFASKTHSRLLCLKSRGASTVKPQPQQTPFDAGWNKILRNSSYSAKNAILSLPGQKNEARNELLRQLLPP